MARPDKVIENSKPSEPPRLYETHAHTILCRHATGTAEAYCLRGLEVGLAGIIFSEHNPMPASYSHQERLLPGMMDTYIELVQHVAASFKRQFDVRLGIECDFLPAYKTFLTEQLRSHEFEYVLGSVHCQISEFKQLASPSEPEQYEAVYYEVMAQAAESGLFDALSHPHMSNAILGRNTALNPRNITRFLNRLAETPVALEINTSGRSFWDAKLYAEAQRRNIPVILAGDAHAPSEVGSHFSSALTFLHQVGYASIATIIGERMIMTPLNDALDHIRSAYLSYT